MIDRDPRAASQDPHDLIVVGGGAYGVALTLEAARRGLRPLLIERHDFGAQTSWNSLRIVHGGLRYLQSLDLNRFRESVSERRWFLAHFPDLVHPLPCLMPLYGGGMRRPSILRCALLLNDLLSRRRNRGVQEDRALPSGRVLSEAQTVEWFPAVDRRSLRGAALWHDATMPNSQRLLMEMLRWATTCGATVLNYAAASRLLTDRGAARGLEVEDLACGEKHEFRSAIVVNCAGPWCRELATAFDRDVPELFAPSIAFNALLDREPLSTAALAVAPRTPDARVYFLVPWQGRILAGTFHAACARSREESSVEPVHLDAFLRHLNLAIPGLDLHQHEVMRVHWGFLPARNPGSVQLATRELILHHGQSGGPEGLISVSGVKFTTARLVAEKTLRSIFERKGAPLPPLAATPRPPATAPPSLDGLERLLATDLEQATMLLRGLSRDEAVRHLDDLMLRRTDWGMDPRRGLSVARSIATLLDWDEARITCEVERLEQLIA